MEVIAYCLGTFLLGFILAWLFKKTPPSNTREIESQVNDLKIQNVSLEKDKQYLTADKESINVQIEKKSSSLQEAERVIAQFTTRIEGYEIAIESKKQEMDVLLTKKNEAEKELQRTDKENH